MESSNDMGYDLYDSNKTSKDRVDKPVDIILFWQQKRSTVHKSPKENCKSGYLEVAPRGKYLCFFLSPQLKLWWSGQKFLFLRKTAYHCVGKETD
jgi:hypothetical protein